MASDSHIHHHVCPPRAAPRCSQTGREYELGSGSFSFEEQTQLFLQDDAIREDLPRPGEVCPQTGRAYEIAATMRIAETKTAQTLRFVREAEAEASLKSGAS